MNCFKIIANEQFKFWITLYLRYLYRFNFFNHFHSINDSHIYSVYPENKP